MRTDYRLYPRRVAGGTGCTIVKISFVGRDGEAMPSECRVSHKQINRLPAELPPPTKTQMHLTLKSCLPSMTLYIAMSGGSPPRLPRHTLERQQYKYKKDLPL